MAAWAARRRRAARPLTRDALPFKANADRRRHIPKQRFKVTNWRDYDASLRQRDSLTVWVTNEAIATWQAEPRTTRGGQLTYSPLAILTGLTLRAVFRLALRQTEGLIGFVIRLLGFDLAVPDHFTLSRRAETLEVLRPRVSAGVEPVHLLVDSAGLKLSRAGRDVIEKALTDIRRLCRAPKGMTRVSCMLGIIDMRAGAGTVSPLRIRSGQGTIVGQGRFDLYRDQIDVTIGSQSPTTNDCALDILFRISGPISDPDAWPSAGKVSCAVDADRVETPFGGIPARHESW